MDNVYQAADLLRQDAENGGNGVASREDNVDADEGVPGAGGAVSIRIRAARGNTAEQDHRAERRDFPAGAAGAGVGVC